MHLFLNISDLLIDFDTRYPDYIRQRCARYLVEPSSEVLVTGCEPDFLLRASEEDIELSNVENVGLMEAELYTTLWGSCIPFSCWSNSTSGCRSTIWLPTSPAKASSLHLKNWSIRK